MSEATQVDHTIKSGTDPRCHSCSVCGSEQFKTWRWEGLEACANCGYVRQSILRNHNLEEVQGKYFDQHFTLKDDVFTRFYEQLNAKRRLRDLRNYNIKGRALEVGIGHGRFLVALHDAGYQVDGIDLSASVCESVQARYGLPVYNNTLKAYADKKPPGTYDLIVMCHVLEHMESPSLSLQAARRLLKPTGILYIAAPNIAAWDAHLPGWTGYEPYHAHYFDMVSLRRILQAAGFCVVRERTFEPISGWFNAIVRSIRHRTPDLQIPERDRKEVSYPNGIVLTLFNMLRIASGLLLSPFRWAQSLVGYGEELIIIAQPEQTSMFTHDNA